MTPTLTRRSFLVASGALTLAVGFGARATAQTTSQAGPREINAWITLEADSTVRVALPGVEMGQGVHGALARFAAEELDADWSRVVADPAPARPDLYGNPEFFGMQITGGSRTMLGYQMGMRQGGAQARWVLLQAAARIWDADPATLTTEPHAVVHPDGRRADYADLIARAEVPETLPAFFDPDPLPRSVFDHLTGEDLEEGGAPEAPAAPVAAGPALPLKPRSAFRLIGVDAPRPDVPAKVDGSAIYGSDVIVPGVVHAVVETAPVQGQAPASVDDAAARAVPGVIDVVTLPYGVAVVAESFWAAQRGRGALAVTWAEGGAAGYDSAAEADRFAAIARDPDGTPGVRTLTQGDDAAARAALAGDVLTHEVRFEFTYHATMEPQSATVRPILDGDAITGAEVWTSHQGPAWIAQFAAEAMGLAVETVTAHTPYVGGGYGRRTEGEVTTDAALVAAAIKRPVKVTWTREDDLLRNPHRQSYVGRMEAAVEGERLVASRYRAVSDSWAARRMPFWFQETGGAEVMNWVGAIHEYQADHQLIDCVTERGPINVCLLRGVGQSQARMVVETMIDKVAARAGVDPLDWRLANLGGPIGEAGSPEAARAVLERVAEMSDWRTRAEGRGKGVALVPYDGSYLAVAADASVDEAGRIAVHHLWAALECGTVVSPDAVRGQIEGGALMGLGMVLKEEVLYEDGRPDVLNYDGYQPLRMADTPPVEVALLPSAREMSGGVGQVATAAVGPAVANAVAAVTGAWPTHVPMTPARVRAAMGG